MPSNDVHSQFSLLLLLKPRGFICPVLVYRIVDCRDIIDVVVIRRDFGVQMHSSGFWSGTIVSTSAQAILHRPRIPRVFGFSNVVWLI